jgi:hypothetical protein
MDVKEIGNLEWKRKMLIMLLIFILFFFFFLLFFVYFITLYFYRLYDDSGLIFMFSFFFLIFILGIIINIYIDLFNRQIQDFIVRYFYNRYGFLYSKQSNEIRIEIESIPLVDYMKKKYVGFFKSLRILEEDLLKINQNNIFYKSAHLLIDKKSYLFKDRNPLVFFEGRVWVLYLPYFLRNTVIVPINLSAKRDYYSVSPQPFFSFFTSFLFNFASLLFNFVSLLFNFINFILLIIITAIICGLPMCFCLWIYGYMVNFAKSDPNNVLIYLIVSFVFSVINLLPSVALVLYLFGISRYLNLSYLFNTNFIEVLNKYIKSFFNVPINNEIFNKNFYFLVQNEIDYNSISNYTVNQDIITNEIANQLLNVKENIGDFLVISQGNKLYFWFPKVNIFNTALFRDVYNTLDIFEKQIMQEFNIIQLFLNIYSKLANK